MKKSTNKIVQHHKLILRREAIALLTTAQLGKVAGGNGTWPPYINTDETVSLYE
jgi:hypothetical protein